MDLLLQARLILGLDIVAGELAGEGLDHGRLGMLRRLSPAECGGKQGDESLELLDVALLRLVLQIQLFEKLMDCLRPLLLVWLVQHRCQLVLQGVLEECIF